MSANSGPGYAARPDYPIGVHPAGVRVQVKAGGEIVADSRDALRMDEGKHAPIFYLPRNDVRMERLLRSEHHSYCPFKGEASYYSLAGGAENAVWTYEQPYDEVAAIKDLLAFYPDKFEVIVS